MKLQFYFFVVHVAAGPVDPAVASWQPHPQLPRRRGQHQRRWTFRAQRRVPLPRAGNSWQKVSCIFWIVSGSQIFLLKARFWVFLNFGPNYSENLSTNHLNTNLFEIQISNGLVFKWSIYVYDLCTRLTIQILNQYTRKQEGVHLSGFKWLGCPVF